MNSSAAFQPTNERPQSADKKKMPKDWFAWMPQKLRDAPYWVLAIVLHLLLLLIATALVIFNVVRVGDIAGNMYDGGGQEGVDVTPMPAQPQIQPTTSQNNPSTSTNPSDISNILSTSGAAATDFSVSQEFASADVSSVSPSPVSGQGRGIPGPYANRIGNKGNWVRKGKGQPQTEAAVNKALEWLKRHQNEDGSWGEDYKSAMTGLAVLCYLAHGDVQGTEKYGNVVDNGVKWLIAESKRNNGRMGNNRPEYQHAIASLALAENYAMAPTVPDLEEAAKKAISIIIKGQQGDGGYAYGYVTSGGHHDLSVGGWNYQALEAAYLGRMEVDGVEPALQKAVGYIKAHFNGGKGSFGYVGSDDERWTLRGVGVYNLQLLLNKEVDGEKEWKKTNEVKASLEAFLNDDRAKFDWQATRGSVLYGWYYNTYMAFLGEAQYWSYWNAQFNAPLIREQQRDGHWPLPPGEDGHITDSLKKSADMDVYSTALCCLMLQVFWRHLVTG